MKIIKLKSIINSKLKRYILYAVGELCLIVLGILLALYINNRNSNSQYKKQIDNNIIRTSSELKINILEAQQTIERIREKDSLIYLVMNDSIKPEMYYNNFDLSYLILYYYDLNIVDKAYQNLVKLNISDNKYREELISKLKELYAINEKIKESNDRMSKFVYEQSLPLVAKKTKSFGDLTYKGEVKKDVVDFFSNSQEYKSYVSQYAIISIKNQLRHNKSFLKKAYSVYAGIAEKYDIDREILLKKDSLISMHKGLYLNKKYNDTLVVKSVNDSIFLYRNNDFKLNLIPINDHNYFTDNKGGGYFVNFSKKDDAIIMKLNNLSYLIRYVKIE